MARGVPVLRRTCFLCLAFVCSHRHMPKHPLTRGIGLRRVFRQAGYKVFMVQEPYTSKRCSVCGVGDCTTFRWVKNPRREKHESVIRRHGLTRCDHCTRLFDRDSNAARNMLLAAKCALLQADRPV